MKLASSFDGIDSAGKPVLSSERTAILAPDERAGVTEFLRGGGFVIGTSARSKDMIDPSLGRVVPMIFSTDGTWIWPAAVLYYLVEHEVPIQNEFLSHIRQCAYTAAVPTSSHIQQALRTLENEAREASSSA